MADASFGLLSMAFFTPQWLVLTSPVWMLLVIFALLAFQLGPRRRQPLGISRALLAGMGVAIALTFALGGAFGSPRTMTPPRTPLSVWLVWVIFAVEVILGAAAVWRAHRRWTSTLVALPILWVGMVIAWLASWAISAGGTLGAL
jgi:hypothetical protein